MKNSKAHSNTDIVCVASLFFAVRGLVRTKLAQGKKLNPYAWLHIETMIYIRDHEGPAMRAIADHLSITAPSATSLVSVLVKNGLVRREQDTRDARASRIYLTKKGEKLLTATQAQGHKVLAEVFSPLSVTELATLNRLLGKVLSGKGGAQKPICTPAKPTRS
ncbi:MAG: MarR family winged helix-turn-helix transcriptional regulator [Candidatus Paceibacteria bacterium]